MLFDSIMTVYRTEIDMIVGDFIDVIITDIGLPNIDGNEYTVLYRYWEKKSHRYPVPIIGLSAHTSDEIKREAIAAGMNAVLAKPINSEKINEILKLLVSDERLTSNS
jgi:CheY-like chemotaxis protein